MLNVFLMSAGWCLLQHCQIKSHLHVCCLVLNFSSLNTTPFQGSNKHKQIVKLELRRKTVFVWMLGRAAAAGHNCDDAASFKPEEPYKSH